VCKAGWLLLALVLLLNVEASIGEPLVAQLSERRLTVPEAIGHVLPGLDSRKPHWFDVNRNLPPPTHKHSDYRWEGGAIGALVLGGLALGLAAGMCNSDSGTKSCTGPVVGSFLVGALVGGVSGLFVGSSIPKGEPDSLQAEATE
jgi:hypothetical protein